MQKQLVITGMTFPGVAARKWQGRINMLTLSSVMIGSAQPRVLAAYYEKVLGRPADWTEGDWYGWQLGSVHFSIGAHSEVSGKAKEPQRLILNFETTDVKGEYGRIKSLGATVIKEPYEMEGAWIATFADPDGNYYQLMTPWEAGVTKREAAGAAGAR
jgi:predicted enzyme related to lactoylglutathione lyase